jgi:hypothetical protein
VAPPEAGHVLKAPDDVIRAHRAKQEDIQGQGGGTDITVPEHEAAEQPGMGAVRRIVEVTVSVHQEQEHVSVSQVGAGRHACGAILTVLVSERQLPGRMLDHQVEHPAGELVVVDACVAR